MDCRVHLTMKSANAKTGPIPVSTSARDTCPVTCGMRSACYASAGPLALHWSAVSDGSRGYSWGDLCADVAAMPEGQLWRHNQAGDLPTRDGARIDADALALLVEANHGRRGFTYTHHRPDDAENAMAIASANGAGFTINLSADSIAEADVLADLDIGPVVCVMPADATENAATPAGRRVVVCPATQRDGVSCATCQLCQRADRSVIVGFPAHGTRSKVADSIARRVIPMRVAA